MCDNKTSNNLINILNEILIAQSISYCFLLILYSSNTINKKFYKNNLFKLNFQQDGEYNYNYKKFIDDVIPYCIMFVIIVGFIVGFDDTKQKLLTTKNTLGFSLLGDIIKYS